MKQTLWIDLQAGISGDRFAGALIGLGAPEKGIKQAILAASEELGLMDAHAHLEFLPDGMIAHQFHITSLEESEPFSLEDAPAILDKVLARAEIQGNYADFARLALEILCKAEASANRPTSPTPTETISLSIIGTARTPYTHKAPYQPQPENLRDGEFFIQVAPQYMTATKSLETFSHIFVLSYLDKTLEPELSVRPPWKDDSEHYGTFATRSPNRPSPIGLTRVRLHHIEENRIYTGPLDLFDGTPILDIKPFIRTLDGMADEDDLGNDGWLEGSDHLELHRLGIPHAHPGSAGRLYQSRTLIAILTGIAWGLQYLEVELLSVVCMFPLTINPEHDPELKNQSILDKHNIPYRSEDISDNLVTPEGAAILAALSPKFAQVDNSEITYKRSGLGLGTQILQDAPQFGALRLGITKDAIVGVNE